MKKENIQFTEALNTIAGALHKQENQSGNSPAVNENEFANEVQQIKEAEQTAEAVASKVIEKYGNVLTLLTISTAVKSKKLLKSINGWVTFFGILTIIGILGYLIYYQMYIN